MALLFECIGKCCRNMLDTADIVRDACFQQLSRPCVPRLAKRKAAPMSGRPISLRAQSFYFTGFSRELLADSTQFVIPPVLSTKRVIGNCGAQSTSRPLKLPVMLPVP